MAPPGLHILLTEDDAALRDLLTELLTEEGYGVTYLPLVTLDAVAELAPDLILLDYYQADEPIGIELVEALRSKPATATIPVVLLTGAQAAMAASAAPLATLEVPVILKPFDLDELLTTIRRHLASGTA